MLGIAVADWFTGTAWRVEVEKELALRSQLLDVAIFERTDGAAGVPPGVPDDLPDGLETLGAHNLVTYKSQHEALTPWTLDELVGHYVAYRKLVSPRGGLVSEDAFGLFAIAARFPDALARVAELRPAGSPGVFDVLWGARQIRLVVLREIADHPRNAVWGLFSADRDRLRAATRQYQAQHPGALALLLKLYKAYKLEDPELAYTMEEFVRESREAVLRDLTPEERHAIIDGMEPEEVLKRFSAEEILKQYSAEDVLKQYSAEDRLKGLEPEDRLKGMEPEDRLKGMEPEDRLKGMEPEDVLRGLGPDALRRLKDRLDRMH